MITGLDRVLAWHFLADDLRLGYGDGRIVEAGKTYTTPSMRRRIVPCSYGMHASISPLDALGYAGGSVVCRVELSGELVGQVDKVVARNRRVLWMADAKMTIERFGRWAAIYIASWAESNPDIDWKCPPTAKQYLETGEQPLRRKAIRECAWLAAQSTSPVERNVSRCLLSAIESSDRGSWVAATRATEIVGTPKHLIGSQLERMLEELREKNE